MAKVAILVDGGFYRKEAKHIWGEMRAKDMATHLIDYCKKHLDPDKDELYRIFYYDCPPLKKKIQNPLSGELIDFEKSPLTKWYDEFRKALVCKRKVALREGRLAEETASYIINSETLKKLCAGELVFDSLKPEDLFLDVRQKGVDMKIGVDIASLAYKKQVEKIVLIAGDSDFVPASKLARREGVDFVLDALRHHINPDLNEHIDGLTTKAPKKEDWISNK